MRMRSSAFDSLTPAGEEETAEAELTLGWVRRDCMVNEAARVRAPLRNDDKRKSLWI